MIVDKALHYFTAPYYLSSPNRKAVRIMFSVAMYASYALQFYVPVEIIWPILRKRVKKEEWKKPLERIFRCFLVLCTFAIAIAIPHLG